MSRSANDHVQLSLLGGCELSYHGQRVCLPLGACRLLGYLALHDRSTVRATTAEALWPHRHGGRAAANLRSALWKARAVGDFTLVDCQNGRLRLAPSVQVDLRDAQHWAHEITGQPRPAQPIDDHDRTIAALARELLPDWSDDWLILERERWDQVRLHALETLARYLTAAERYLPALEAALAAVAIEPVRESANRAVIEVHLAEGNAACAIKHYQRYRGLVQRELGVSPSLQMDRLIGPLVTR